MGTLADGGTALYGLTTGSAGTLYKINRDGSGLQIVRSFDLSTTNGFRPTGAPLLHGSTLYATTANGGTGGVGCVFSITTNGLNFQLLHSFGGGTNGVTPAGYLALAGNTLFGTSGGGANGQGAVFSIRTNGTAFKLLHSFNSTDGRGPVGGVTVTGGKVFGLTSLGGTNDNGTAFMMNTDGTGFQLLHDFADLDGKNMSGSPVLAGNVLYGFGESGGNSINRGTIFSLTLTNALPISFDCVLTPALATNILGNAHTVTATVTSNSLASVGALVSFAVTGGPHLGQTGTATTDASGQGSFTYTGNTVGTDTIRAISLDATGTASKVWISTNAPPVTHELAITTLKAPKKIKLTDKKPYIVGKFSVTIQNNSTNTEVIADIGTLANLVTVSATSLGNCINPAVVLVTPKFTFPKTLAPKKKLTLAYTAGFACANDPDATTKTDAHNDFQVTATVHAAVLGGTDSLPANDVCPHAPFGTDKGCGGKGGTDVFIDVTVKGILP